MYINGVGSEVMQRIAAPMIGGVVSSAVLTLLVIPAVYYMVIRKEQGTIYRPKRDYCKDVRR
jgi:Cu(I)/Ag(I) efflux system membrane protein CusA/SilA